MRRHGHKLAIALLAVGAVGGFAHGCRSMGHHRSDRWQRAAEVCVDEALREAGKPHRGSDYGDDHDHSWRMEAKVRQMCADEARRQTGGRFAISPGGLSERPLASAAELPPLPPNGAETALAGPVRAVR